MELAGPRDGVGERSTVGVLDLRFVPSPPLLCSTHLGAVRLVYAVLRGFLLMGHVTARFS